MDNLNLANVVIYARYSSAGQNDQSIDGQLAKCREYAQQRGYRVVGEYCDRALSGRYAETRPEFQRMISDSAKHAFDFVLVWKLDCFSRDRYDSAIYKKKLRGNGVRVLSVTEGVGDSSESVLLEAILEAMAEEYSRQLAQNVRRGMRQNAEKGLSLGGLAPLGYRVVNKQYEINEDEARIVRFIHEQYADGAGQKQIVADCARLGYRNQRGNPLTLASVKRILANERYVGRYDYLGEIVIEDAFPAIVSKELKKRVRDRLKANSKAPGHAKAKVEYLLHGKLFCGECGAPMIGECGRGRHGATYYYYTCAVRKKQHTCKKRNERKDELEASVVDYIGSCVLTDSWIDGAAERVVAEYQKSYDASGIKPLEKQIRDADKEIDQLVDALISATAEAARRRINERIETAEARKQALEADLASLRIASRVQIKKEDIAAWLNQFRTGDRSDLEYRKKVIDLFVNAIYLYDDSFKLFLNVTDSSQVTYADALALAPPPRFGFWRVRRTRYALIRTHHIYKWCYWDDRAKMKDHSPVWRGIFLFYHMLIVFHELVLRARAVLVDQKRLCQGGVEFRAVESEFYRDGVVVRVHHVHGHAPRPAWDHRCLNAHALGNGRRLIHRPVRAGRAVGILHMFGPLYRRFAIKRGRLRLVMVPVQLFEPADCLCVQADFLCAAQRHGFLHGLVQLCVKLFDIFFHLVMPPGYTGRVYRRHSGQTAYRPAVGRIRSACFQSADAPRYRACRGRCFRRRQRSASS